MKTLRTLTKTAPVGLLVLALTLVVTPSRAATFTFTTIDFPGAPDTTAVGINDLGQVVGVYNETVGPSHGFLDTNGSFTTIDVPGGTNTNARGINGAGQIVGFYRAGTLHGFLDTNGSFTTIDVPGATDTLAFRINDGGQIVGTFFTGGLGHGFLLDHGSFTTIDVPGASFTEAFGINDTGQIVGAYTDAGGSGHGFLRDTNGSFTTIDPPGAFFTAANGINDGGQIVGFYHFGGHPFHGFLRDTNGSFTTIDVPGAADTEANGINDAGQIVGGYGVGGVPHSFVTTATPQTVPFAAFTAKVEIALGARIDDSFELKSNFTLGSGSNGIAPLTEDVKLELNGGPGSFTTTIPAGSFKKDKKGRLTFEGTIHGVGLEAKITPLGGNRFEFKAEGEHANLADIVNPVTVKLTIGNDSGTTTTVAKFDQNERDGDNHDGDR